MKQTVLACLVLLTAGACAGDITGEPIESVDEDPGDAVELDTPPPDDCLAAQTAGSCAEHPSGACAWFDLADREPSLCLSVFPITYGEDGDSVLLLPEREATHEELVQDPLTSDESIVGQENAAAMLASKEARVGLRTQAGQVFPYCGHTDTGCATCYWCDYVQSVTVCGATNVSGCHWHKYNYYIGTPCIGNRTFSHSVWKSC